MHPRQKRIRLFFNVTAIILGVAAAVFGFINPAISIVLAVLLAGAATVPIVMDHRAPTIRVGRVAGSDTDTWAGGLGSNTLIRREAKPTDPKPLRTGKTERLGKYHLAQQDDGRWQVRTNPFGRSLGLVQRGTGDPGTPTWHARHPTQGWIGRYLTQLEACDELASRR